MKIDYSNTHLFFTFKIKKMELQITALNKTYTNGVRALQDVNLSIKSGLFGLLGPNGAGKSTLMRTIATLQEADTGAVVFKGIDVNENKQEIRKLLGYLPQEFGVYPKVNAIEMLDYLAIAKGIINKKERQEQVNALLNEVNLYDVRKKKVANYSGGMRQRFGIAQALLGNPKLIIVDEPTAGLDPLERNRFNNLLSDISEDKVVILSTHIVKDVSDLCSDMAIIAEGKVLIQASPKLLMEKLQGRVWQKKIQKSEYNNYKQQYNIISTFLNEGQPIIHVLSDEHLDSGFIATNANLEDVYFSYLN